MVLVQPSIFRTAPDKDHFHLFKNGVLDGVKVVKLLKFKKKDVSVAANVPITAVRYASNKMPVELKQSLTEWAIALNVVADFFQDTDKTILWFSIPNPVLGGMSPRDMIRVGRFKKLFNFIQVALDENLRKSECGLHKGLPIDVRNPNVVFHFYSIGGALHLS